MTSEEEYRRLKKSLEFQIGEFGHSIIWSDVPLTEEQEKIRTHIRNLTTRVKTCFNLYLEGIV